MELTDPEVKTLEACTEGRNQFIHDQGVYRLRLDDQGELRITSKACPVHTRDIPRAILIAALLLQTKICSRLYHRVMENILKTQNEKYSKTAAWIENIGHLVAGAMQRKGTSDAVDDRDLPIDLSRKWTTDT